MTGDDVLGTDGPGDGDPRLVAGGPRFGTQGRTGDVAWRSWGDGPGVPLVALHGVTDDSGCWSPFAAGWAQSRRVLAVDARGHGGTPLGDGGFTIAALADDVAHVVRRELSGGPVVVIGHSLGGLVAEELALAAPELVAALVLEDPAWRRDRNVDPSGRPRGIVDAVRAGAARTLEDLLDLAPPWPAAEIEPWALSKTRVDRRLAEVDHEWDARDWPAAMAGVGVPVTLLVGQPDLGAIVDEEQEAQVAALLGDRLRVVRLTAGHNVRREAPGAVDAAVRQALVAADRRR